jgi:hypothetical protein
MKTETTGILLEEGKKSFQDMSPEEKYDTMVEKTALIESEEMTFDCLDKLMDNAIDQYLALMTLWISYKDDGDWNQWNERLFQSWYILNEVKEATFWFFHGYPTTSKAYPKKVYSNYEEFFKGIDLKNPKLKKVGFKYASNWIKMYEIFSTKSFEILQKESRE